jgi:DNA-binding IclR family transcriptional regulator
VGRSDIAEAVGLRASRASELLAEMVAEGSLVAEGEGRSRVYRAKARS